MNQDAVREVLTAALAAITTANVPTHLRPVAFEKAIELLVGTAPPAPPPGGSATNGGSGGGADVPTEDERLTRIAQKTGADPAALPYVYDLDDDVTILVKRSR